MAVVNSGDPINTLRSALDAYTTVQETMIAEAAKLKKPEPSETQAGNTTTEGGVSGAVSS